MDPVSIVTATGTIIKLVSTASLTLYTFISETNNVDQTVKDLAAEVNGLKRTLLEVDSVLKQPSVASAEKRIATDDSEALWNTFYSCLEECQLTIVRLASALDGLNKKSSSWSKQAYRQAKLNLKKDDINSLRSQIHTHSITLGTALQLANIRATCLAPGAVIDGLGPRIDALQKSLDEMAVSLRAREHDTSHIPQVSPQALSSSTQKLHSLGKQVLATATTVYGSSVGHGSAYGDEVDHEAFVRTMNWIPEATLYDRTYSTSSRLSLNHQQTTPSIVDSGVDMVESRSATVFSEGDAVDSDSEAEFELEVAQGLLEKGREVFESANYKGAMGFLQKGITAVNRLPQNLRPQLDTVEIPLMIATCRYHLGDIDEASRDLRTLIQTESASTQDAVRKCQISHLLSQICLVKNEAEAAEYHCRDSLKGRRRLLGKGHQDYLASLSLLSEIHLIRGKHEEAAVLKAMIPPHFRQPAEMVRLKTLTDSQISTFSIPPAQTGSQHVVFDLELQYLRGHIDDVYGLSFSPVNSLLASGARDSTVRLWDPKTGREVQKLEGHNDRVTSVAFSPDGSLLASASWDRMIWLWDPKTGRKVRKLEGHINAVRSIVFSPDGSLLAGASYNDTIRLWDPKTGREVRKLEGHTGFVFSVVFLYDGSSLASASQDRTIRLWDPKTGREVRKLEVHTISVTRVVFSPDGSLLASASWDRTISLWDPKTGREVRKLEGHTSDISSIAFSPDGSLLASALDEKTLCLWDPKTGERTQKLRVNGRIHACAFSPNGLFLAVGQESGEILLWNARHHEGIQQ